MRSGTPDPDFTVTRPLAYCLQTLDVVIPTNPPIGGNIVQTPAAPWGTVTDGTAIGPTEVIEITADESAQVTALWSDAEGIVLDIDLPDVPLSRDVLGRVNDLADMLYELPPPA